MRNSFVSIFRNYLTRNFIVMQDVLNIYFDKMNNEVT